MLSIAYTRAYICGKMFECIQIYACIYKEQPADICAYTHSFAYVYLFAVSIKSFQGAYVYTIQWMYARIYYVQKRESMRRYISQCTQQKNTLLVEVFQCALMRQNISIICMTILSMITQSIPIRQAAVSERNAAVAAAASGLHVECLSTQRLCDSRCCSMQQQYGSSSSSISGRLHADTQDTRQPHEGLY